MFLELSLVASQGYFPWSLLIISEPTVGPFEACIRSN